MNISKLIIKKLLNDRVKTPADLAKIKREMAKKYKISCLSNVELLKEYHKLLKEKRIKKSPILEKILTKRPIRTLSGVAVITVLTKPYRCPGRCIYCPEEKLFPKSYLSGEPAAQRAKNLNFNPYPQVKTRLESLKAQGHPIDKIELIVLGGTFSYYPRKYQEWFVKECFKACNGFKNKRGQTSQDYPKNKRFDLKNIQRKNEKAKCRIVGLTIETRPDLITEEEAIWLRKLGVTKVELGAQILDDKILKFNQRGHGIKEITEATKILKDAGFKVSYHLMLNLPGSNIKKDLASFKMAFKNPHLKPDWLKIYPCVVCKGSKLYALWKQGKYKPYTNKQLIEVLVKIKSQILPYWVRVGRLFRDIPVPKIEAGCKISNLREVVQGEMNKRGLKCKCIRCREIKNLEFRIKNLELRRREYEASKGKEIFLSFEDTKNDKVIAFLRLRIPSQNKPRTKDCGTVRGKHFIPALQDAAIIRELHTYGLLHPINYGSPTSIISPQHRGLGKKLIKEAEKITRDEFKLNKVAVISGVGVREYYRKLGYKLKNDYMIKKC